MACFLMHVFLPCLDMTSSGNTWEGYLWGDGWPVTPPRPRMQLTTSTEPVNELPDEREMIVEQSSAAAPVINTAAMADVDTISNSNTESTVQVKDIHRYQLCDLPALRQ